MSTPVLKRKRTWRRLLGTTPPFVVICGIIAVVYVMYRIALLAFPAIVVSGSILDQDRPQAEICEEKESIRPRDPAPIVSVQYQHRISEQSRASDNRIKNPGIKANEDGSPRGYSHSLDDNDAVYRYAIDVDGSRYLSVKGKKSDAAQQPAWLPPAVTVHPEETYAYRMAYRSTVPVEITLELKQIKSSELSYRVVTVLEPSSTWKDFWGHLIVPEKTDSVRITATAKSAGTLDTKSYGMFRMADARLKQGLVSVTFDDGVQSAGVNALPILDKHKVRSTQYVISEMAQESAASYMNVPMLKEFTKRGHEIGSHSLSHCNMTSLTGSDLEKNATQSKEFLESQGLGPVRSFTYPYGRYDATTQEAMRQKYDFIRTSDAGYNDLFFDETNIRSMSVIHSTSEKTFKEWLEYAHFHKLWLVLVYHRVGETGTYNVSSEQLNQQMGMVANSGLRIAPLSEAGDIVKTQVPKAPQALASLPEELPRTGTEEALLNVLGVTMLVVTGYYWWRSKEILAGRRND